MVLFAIFLGMVGVGAPILWLFWQIIAWVFNIQPEPKVEDDWEFPEHLGEATIIDRTERIAIEEGVEYIVGEVVEEVDAPTLPSHRERQLT